ncbi:MAG: 2-C-methyl-D-erythritol 4-phosphate cytidylyltransferase [Lachnospiraceae bacterium]
MMKTTAIVLAAGQGKRMGSDVAKQYLLLCGRPVLYYTLRNFEDSIVDEVILVTGKEQIEYCKKEIVEAYGFQKVTQIVAGGKERYHSVAMGLCAAAQSGTPCDYVLIHDGARPFVTPGMIEKGIEAVQKYDACVVGMPVKDTIKISDENGFAVDTPKRNLVWQVQTPQIFAFPLIKSAYDKLIEEEGKLLAQGVVVTDDAMVMELFSAKRVKLIEGSYENIKITTPEDLEIAECFLKA